jgi:hypothetical protein
MVEALLILLLRLFDAIAGHGSRKPFRLLCSASTDVDALLRGRHGLLVPGPAERVDQSSSRWDHRTNQLVCSRWAYGGLPSSCTCDPVRSGNRDSVGMQHVGVRLAALQLDLRPCALWIPRRDGILLIVAPHCCSCLARSRNRADGDWRSN